MTQRNQHTQPEGQCFAQAIRHAIVTTGGGSSGGGSSGGGPGGDSGSMGGNCMR